MVGLTLLAAIWEYTTPKETTLSDAVPYIWAQLYPGSVETQYSIGRVLIGKGEFEKAREHFETALATGSKTNEALLYDYAVTLVHLEADHSEIDLAISKWRHNFPYSKEPDPLKGQFFIPK